MIAAESAGIRVFATGGIGGVHRGALGSGGGAPASFDISADLDELARTPVAVVCAGPKAILDVPLTLEYLETRGVPVVAVGIDEVPGFYSRRSGHPGAGLGARRRRPPRRSSGRTRRSGSGPAWSCATRCPRRTRWTQDVAREAIERALREADEAGITGGAVTPWLLARVAAITDGASVTANVALIVDNARVGGLLAAALLR